MDIEPLRLLCGEAFGNGLESVPDRVEMIEAFLQPEAGKVGRKRFCSGREEHDGQQSRHIHYYFSIRDEVLGPFASASVLLPFQATYYLNGHSFMERELERAQVKFRKNDNAFLAVDDVAQLQAPADRFSPEIIRKRLDYWTHLLARNSPPKERDQMNLSRFYIIAQIEYCRNFIFKRHFPIHKIFERGCELGLSRLTRKLKGKLANVVEQVEHGEPESGGGDPW